MPKIPEDSHFDSTLAMFLDPYRYISRRCRELGEDLFACRLLLQRAICLTGSDAAELFCDEQLFQRRGAAPVRLHATLFGKGGVQGLDGDAHRHRKQLLVSLTSGEQVPRLVECTKQAWHAQLPRWQVQPELVLYDEMRMILCQAACDWAGVPLEPRDLKKRTGQLTALFESPGSNGPALVWGRIARWQTDRWLSNLVEDIRRGRYSPSEECAAHRIAWHRQLDGSLLPPNVAAVELLNLLRPIVAVAVYLTFVADAVEEHLSQPERADLQQVEKAESFVQEVRRYYPFFPAIAAVVRKSFEWKGYPFEAGTRCVLDLYGTNHDQRLWPSPDVFQPWRFLGRTPTFYELIPQGPGDAERNHRCPGERIALELMKLAAQVLTTEIEYRVPRQDRSIDFRRLPALPRSRLIITGVRRRQPHVVPTASA